MQVLIETSATIKEKICVPYQQQNQPLRAYQEKEVILIYIPKNNNGGCLYFDDNVNDNQTSYDNVNLNANQTSYLILNPNLNQFEWFKEFKPWNC